MSAIAGIDFDSNGVFVAFVDEEDGRWLGKLALELNCGPGDAFDRARRVRDLMPPRGAWDDVCAIGIESTFSQSFKATAALARIQGAILACLPRAIVTVPLAANHKPPYGWKANVLGRTNATKDDVRAYAIIGGAPEGLVQDLYDAFAIANATRALWETRREDAA